MKTCPYCAESIQDAAVVCRYCQRELAPPPTAIAGIVVSEGFDAKGRPAAPEPPTHTNTTPPDPPKASWPAFVIVLLFAVAAAALMHSFLSGNIESPSAAAAAAGPIRSRPQLAILNSASSSGYGYHKVSGQVKNLTDRPLQNVMAVTTWYDNRGQFITTDDALIEFDPILPGQTSPYQTMSRSNPAMARYSVEFKFLMGGTIRTDDQRPKTAQPN